MPERSTLWRVKFDRLIAEPLIVAPDDASLDDLVAIARQAILAQVEADARPEHVAYDLERAADRAAHLEVESITRVDLVWLAPTVATTPSQQSGSTP